MMSTMIVLRLRGVMTDEFATDAEESASWVGDSIKPVLENNAGERQLNHGVSTEYHPRCGVRQHCHGARQDPQL
jgi:hypothetical protein